MKILFLDIDGVLNSVRSANAYFGYPFPEDDSDEKFDEIAVNLIRKVCKVTGSKIVLSSTWRLFTGHEKLPELLDLPIIDKTPHKLSSTRGEEIAMWLENNKVERYAIVDDDSDMLKDQLSYFVKVDGKNGLSYENYEQLLKILVIED